MFARAVDLRRAWSVGEVRRRLEAAHHVLDATREVDRRRVVEVGRGVPDAAEGGSIDAGECLSKPVARVRGEGADIVERSQ